MRRNGVTIAWIVLVFATGVSWWLGTGDVAASDVARRGATAAVLIVAFIKARVIVVYFMEVGRAPRALQAGFDAWLAVACFAILALYASGQG